MVNSSKGCCRLVPKKTKPTLFKWDDKYSVGVSSIDAQHQSIVELINQLFEGIQLGQAEETASRTLQRVVSYAKTHFAEEEELMRRCEYPDYKEHKRIHDAFIQEMAGLVARQIRGGPAVAFDTFDFLQSWWIEHIQGTDQKYSSHFKRCGIY